MEAILIFKCTGGGVGDYIWGGRGAGKFFPLPPQPPPPPPPPPLPLSNFDTHARWHPVTQSARSRRSYGKMEDCEQPTNLITKQRHLSLVFTRSDCSNILRPANTL